MCGVPWHSHEGYLAKLIKLGHKVALCEQVETPEEAKKRGGYKALVQRDVPETGEKGLGRNPRGHEQEKPDHRTQPHERDGAGTADTGTVPGSAEF